MTKIDILAKNLLILASAGSGKTYQLGNRVIGCVAQGVEPEKIVALTFTRKAAGEFADSVLTKLANAASDPAEADRLRSDLSLPAADFSNTLERVVRALPRLTFGTMDSFFAKVVRGFQYELGLTGGRFDLLEGARAAAASDEILAEILGQTLEAAGGEEFLHAFRRATIGREEQKVIDGLRAFVASWQGRFRSAATAEWGPAALAAEGPKDWEAEKHGLAAAVRRGLDGIDFNDKRQRAALEKVVDGLEAHTIGSGSLGSPTSLMLSVMEAAKEGNGPLAVRFYKDFMIAGPPADALRDLVRLAADCEMGAAVLRTRAVREVIALHDARCEKQLRRRGLLGFDDVKFLMGRWAVDEESRLSREAVDFRLDARYEHWLLDEFQDTSRAEWNGIVPLLDEAATRDDGSLFVVGDRKQAIYGWRGGDVSLFDEVERRYGTNNHLALRTMPESWRSCPAVLELVNAVCGDLASIRELFGEEMARRWPWEEHVSAKPGLSGEARVEVVAKDDREDRLVALLQEIGIGERDLTCGVLVRTNAQVRATAALLREHGFDVIEEGRRQPVADNAPGVVLLNLVRWLGDPADAFARQAVAMSPLFAVLEERFGTAWQAVWEGALKEARQLGFAGAVEQWIEPLWAGLSEFSQRRVGDVIGALAEFDSSGSGTPREAARWIADLEIPQSPGAAAVQVLTVHKSKGLGFDVVVLPETEDSQVPNHGNFSVAKGRVEGDPWLLEPPPAWVRGLVPAISAAEDAWADDQRYEAMCVLYVALTRAKRGLYVLLPEVPKSRKDADGWASLANWISRSAGRGDDAMLFQSGDPSWWREVGRRQPREAPPSPGLAASVLPRPRTTPSGAKRKTAGMVASPGGMAFGSEVHAGFEKVGWIEDEPHPVIPGEAGKLIAGLLEIPEIREVFLRGGRCIDLFREQPVESISDGGWLSGVIDRLHVIRDSEGRVREVEVIDFKTDAVESPEALIDRYAGQMEAYRKVMAVAFGGVPVKCLLLSTKLRKRVEV